VSDLAGALLVFDFKDKKTSSASIQTNREALLKKVFSGNGYFDVRMATGQRGIFEGIGQTKK